MTLQPIPYSAGATRLNGFYARVDRPNAPGVLVAHESPGITEHVKRRAQDLADLGYAAFVLDLFGVHDLQLDEARRHSTEVMATPGLMFARANAALDVLASQRGVDPTRLAAVGFCLGGVVAVELARHRAPIRCAVGFHPGLKRPAGSPDGEIKAKVLMMIGDHDPVVPPEDRASFAESMTSAHADWQLHVFGGVGHSFTNRAIDSHGMPGFAYNESADRRSWQLMISFLEETLGE